ncbi:MAG: hypothetical protein Kow0090_00060 [Myxococcota bacterium]
MKIYFEDIENICQEIYRVLKAKRHFVLIIGSNTNQTKGVRIDLEVIKICDKVRFNPEALIDSLVRYKEKGSYSGKGNKNPEIEIKKILDKYKISFTSGDLPRFVEKEPNIKRTMDFVVPNKEMPTLIIECSYLTTTSSGQGDKSKTEINIKRLIEKHYRNTLFIGFVDGIGWYVRKNDLKRMVAAYDEVFTFKSDELMRFERFIKNKFKVTQK